jgi:hypothetical protein
MLCILRDILYLVLRKNNKRLRQGRGRMIISHKYKFIFLKTGKTAGTSMEIALSRFCGEADIITPISPEDEKIRRAFGYRGPQNYLIPFSGYSFTDYILYPVKRKQFYNHISAREILQLIGEEIWNEYYTFCFERNPWDRVLSLYYWHYKAEPRPAISQFVNSKSPHALRRRGYNMYTMEDKVVVDRIYLYEQLQREVESISGLLGFPEKLELPRAKASYRSVKKHYRDLLNNDDRRRIETLFSKEIALFGYEF